MGDNQKIGIFAGSFDPVHQGHVDFALAAVEVAELDKVYFMIESQPRHKAGITHLAHRLAMLKITLKHHTSLAILDFPDRQFSVAKTLPRLNQKFKEDELFLIIGSDVLDHLPAWPLVDNLMQRMNLIIGLRDKASIVEVEAKIQQLPNGPDQVIALQSPASDLSSRIIREDLFNGRTVKGLDQDVLSYTKDNWLYASPSNSNSAS